MRRGFPRLVESAAARPLDVGVLRQKTSSTGVYTMFTKFRRIALLAAVLPSLFAGLLAQPAYAAGVGTCTQNWGITERWHSYNVFFYGSVSCSIPVTMDLYTTMYDSTQGYSVVTSGTPVVGYVGTSNLSSGSFGAIDNESYALNYRAHITLPNKWIFSSNPYNCVIGPPNVEWCSQWYYFKFTFPQAPVQSPVALGGSNSNTLIQK